MKKELNHYIQDKRVVIKKPVTKITEESHRSEINKLKLGKIHYCETLLETLKQTK